jgi:hypothetical protein
MVGMVIHPDQRFLGIGLKGISIPFAHKWLKSSKGIHLRGETPPFLELPIAGATLAEPEGIDALTLAR